MNKAEKNFHDMVNRHGTAHCPFCGELVSKFSFKDALSKREYEITGLCQKCQDEFYNQENETRVFHISKG